MHPTPLGEQMDLADIFAGLFVGRLGEKRSIERRRVMAAVCEVCGKGPSWGMSVSHSHRRTKRRWSPNIQRVRAVVKGTPTRLHVCTGCIKSGKVVKVG